MGFGDCWASFSDAGSASECIEKSKRAGRSGKQNGKTERPSETKGPSVPVALKIWQALSVGGDDSMGNLGIPSTAAARSCRFACVYRPSVNSTVECRASFCITLADAPDRPRRDKYECRDMPAMIAHGGEPVLGPGIAVDEHAPKFCAVAP